MSLAIQPDGEAAQRSLTYPSARIEGPAFLEAFDPALSEQGCSLHEADYAGEDRSTLLEELLRFYAFFGLSRQGASELPDHLTVQLEFMHFLTFLEQRGALAGRPVEGLRRAQRDFLSRHLSRLTRGIASRCRSGDPSCVALVTRLREFVEHELAGLS